MPRNRTAMRGLVKKFVEIFEGKGNILMYLATGQGSSQIRFLVPFYEDDLLIFCLGTFDRSSRCPLYVIHAVGWRTILPILYNFHETVLTVSFSMSLR
jgi:hypothetical protein